MLIVEEYEKAVKSNKKELMRFFNEILHETKVKNDVLFGDALFLGHEKLSQNFPYPMFLFNLGYAQALQDVQNEEAARKRKLKNPRNRSVGLRLRIKL